MNRRQMQYFIEVYNCSNIQNAATVLGISRQALSKTISQLEDDLGQKLFLRTSRGIIPTDYSMSILPHIKNLLSEYSYIDGMTTLASQSKNVVSVYALDHVFTYLGAKFFIDFHKKYPNIILSIVDSTDDDAVKNLVEKKANFSIVTGPVDKSRFLCKELFFSNYCVRLSKTHPLASKEIIEYRDLEGQTILGKGRSYNCFREHFDKNILLAGINTKILAETADETIINDILIHSDVLNIGYDYSAVANRSDMILIKPLGGEDDKGQMIYLIREKLYYQSESCQRFEDFLLEWIKENHKDVIKL